MILRASGRESVLVRGCVIFIVVVSFLLGCLLFVVEMRCWWTFVFVGWTIAATATDQYNSKYHGILMCLFVVVSDFVVGSCWQLLLLLLL